MMQDIAAMLQQDDDNDNETATAVAARVDASITRTTTTTVLLSITDQDILCERGHRANHHPGNHRYLQAKERLQPSYLATSNKSYKTRIANELVATVHGWGGRFLRFDKERQVWTVLDAAATRRKASQALREDLTAADREAKRKKYQKKKTKRRKQEQSEDGV